jgi:hypothetical protein
MVAFRAVCVCALVACSGSGSKTMTPVDDGSNMGGEITNMPGNPGLGAHGLRFYRYNVNSPTTISAPTMATQSTGSTMIVSAGRGSRFAFELPTDNKGNTPYQKLGEHAYTRYPDSGTGLYAFANFTGGDNHIVSTGTTAMDEITFSVVEVTGGTRVQQFEWNEPLQAPLTSRSVTTTGPATLVAFWWGDAGVQNDKTAVPNNGFTVIDSILQQGELVQCAVAVKNVAEAGTYDVTWVATPLQGAQLWLVAVQ